MTASHGQPTRTPDISRVDSSPPTIGGRLLAGVLGGLGGGVVFGALMFMMGMLPMIASLVGSTSVAVGFIVHLLISVLIGLALTLLGAGLLDGTLRSALLGVVYGALWWVLGPLLLMPAALRMPVLTVDGSSLASLMGHVIYGLILGLIAAGVLRRR
ncbi:hypothetical protein [Arthrobacter echini]|nr:hypothetical protein [Arthrobacter echini]